MSQSSGFGARSMASVRGRKLGTAFWVGAGVGAWAYAAKPRTHNRVAALKKDALIETLIAFSLGLNRAPENRSRKNLGQDFARFGQQREPALSRRRRKAHPLIRVSSRG